MVRRWLAAFCAVVSLSAAGALAATSAAAGPTTQADGSRTIAVNENTFPSTGATMTVTGSGFDDSIELFLGICGKSIKPADPLDNCLGGSIPTGNTTAAWAQVTKDPDGKTNAFAFGADGSFSATLETDLSVGGTDCLKDGCVLIARSAGDQNDRPADILIALTFTSPTTSSSTTTTTTTTAPTGPVAPDAVSLPEARVGDQQTVVFSGYQPDEDVNVTVLSEPIPIPGIKASSSGVVTIGFRVSEALVPGQHIVQAVGAQSNRIGVAYFQVLPAVVTTSSTPPSTTSSAPTTTTTTTSVTPTTTSASVSSATETTTSVPVVPVPPADSGGSLWWLWVLVALLVVVGGVIGAIALYRRRERQLEQERLDAEQLAAEEQAMQQPMPPSPPTGPVPPPAPPPYDTGGLLSGDDQRLYSGQGNYPLDYPTTRLPDEPPPTQRIGPSDLPTDQIPTVPDEGAPGTGRTQQQPPGGPSPDEPEPPTGRHRSP